MGLFGSREIVDLASPPSQIVVDSTVAAAVPDVGAWFLDWIEEGLGAAARERIRGYVDAARGVNGCVIPSQIPSSGRKETPLSYLASIAHGGSAIPISVWGTMGLSGKDQKVIAQHLEAVSRAQGHAAAAAWAVTARPNIARPLSLEILASGLTESWANTLSFLQRPPHGPKALAKAFRNLT